MRFGAYSIKAYEERIDLMRKITAIVLMLVILLSITVIPAAANGTVSGGNGIKIYIDGKRVDRNELSYTKNGTQYVPLREISNELGAESVIWNNNTKTATVRGKDLVISVTENKNYIIANGRYLYVPELCRVDNGHMMLPANTLCRAFGADAKWDQKTKELNIRTGGKPIESGDSFYNEEDVYWLSRLIFAEAGGESFEGQIAVGNVVVNRVHSDLFPDTVKGVVFDRQYGIQFTPAYSGAIYNTPTSSCVIAAKLALDGADTVGDSLYFSSAYVSCWASRNRAFVVQIDNQSFYA